MSLSWILTSIAMLLVTVGLVLYLTLSLRIFDTAIIVMIFSVCFFVCYACYHYERIMKFDMIR